MGNLEFEPWLEANARPIFDRLLRELGRVFQPKVAWGYFPCRSEGNALLIFDERGTSEIARFDFPRQMGGRHLCLADYFRTDELDVVGFSAVTMGDAISEHERGLFERGEFQEYLFVHGLGVEMAEAMAEYWHLQMRRELGLGGEPESMKELFGAKYHGSRYSFGYPACPRLEDQTKLFA
ncbi:MAG: methionine synthase, partial [Armatimonadota bacterium]